MNKNAVISARIDENTKEKAEKVLKIIGLRPSEAITMFYRQVILVRGLPFKAEIPNRTTLNAMKELENKGDMESFNDVEELFSELES